jgi:hypothetical protein
VILSLYAEDPLLFNTNGTFGDISKDSEEVNDSFILCKVIEEVAEPVT